MNIISFEWDNHKDNGDINGKSVIIGQHLSKLQTHDFTHVEIYGISLDIIDTSKDYPLKRLSCHADNVCSDARPISKEDARKLLYAHIDNALDIMYSEKEIEYIDSHLNVIETLLFDKEVD